MAAIDPRPPLPSTTVAPPPSTTDDTPDFDRSKVSLDVPDALFGSSFNTVTTVSKLFGDLMMVSVPAEPVTVVFVVCNSARFEIRETRCGVVAHLFAQRALVDKCNC